MVTRDGNSTTIVVPCSSDLLSARIVPRCAAAIPRRMASPRPDPLGLVVKNGSKMLVRSSSVIPGPVSDTSTTIHV